MSAVSEDAARGTREWLAIEHDWLDARLAAIFLESTYGAFDEAVRDMATYRGECDAHIDHARQRLFGALAGADPRTVAAEAREWTANARDIRRAADAVESALHAPGRAPIAAFEGLRGAVRRYQMDELRLLDLAQRLAQDPAVA